MKHSRALGSILSLLFFIVTASAQTTTTGSDRTTPIGLKPGAAAGSYSLNDLENINLYNGNLSFRLPLVQMGGRGTAGHTVMLALNTKSWNVKHTQTGSTETWTPTHNLWGNPYSGYGAGRMEGRKSGFGQRSMIGCPPNPNRPPIFETTLTTITFRTPDGTEYDFRDELHGGARLAVGSCPESPYTGQSRGRVFISTDGTAATFTSDIDIHDKVDVPTNLRLFSPSGYLVLRDGTRYRIDGGYVTWISDRNGNKVTFGSGITDSLGRTTNIEYGVTDPVYGLCDRIHIKGFGGAPRILYVTWTNLLNVLRADQTPQTPAQLFPELNGASSGGSYNLMVVSSVVLPDTRSYQFRYNSYGELARVVLPTGGAIEYDMAPGSGVIQASNSQTDVYEIYRRVVERRTYASATDPLSLTNRTTYTVTSGTSIVTVVQLDANNMLLTTSKHYFNGNPIDTLIQEIDWTGSPVETYPDPLEGRETTTETYATNGVSATTVLQTVSNSWQTGTTLGGFPINARVSAATTKLNDMNLVAKKTFLYDQCTGCNSYFNNQTDASEYEFGNGAPGAVVRRTHTDYLVTNPVNAVDYTRHDNNTHLRSLPTQQSVYDGNDVEKARTTFEYDNYVSDSGHAPLTDRVNISGFDPAFTTAYQTRGNLTKTTSWVLSSSTPVSSYQQYDIAGNIVKVIDARGYTTTFDFSDRFGAPDGEARANSGSTELNAAGQYSYAFATAITNALGHTVYGQFDYYLGRPVDGEDANGIVASGYFNDLLDRPTQVIRAANQGAAIKSQSTFSYDDANRIITTTSDQDSYNDNVLKSQIVYDGLGRTTESRQYEGGSNYIAAQTQYDALGRAFKTSNPFRSGETVVWTTSAFDALGRVISVTTADNAVVSTAYSGNTVTVTDQAGKQRKSVTDALGRLTSVYEDPAALNYLTSYSYDTLDNLITVNQGTQTRTFAYDSLKRLTSATNPESGTITYQYDDGGNLRFKTDARGVVTENRYDALNRVTTILYRINGQPDPSTGDVEYLYDNAANGKGRPWLTFKWGSQPFQTAVGAYDELGRVTTLYRLFGNGQGGWNPAYEINATYGLAGQVKTMIYPSGHSVTYNYDDAGRLADKDGQNLAFTGNLGDGTLRTYSTGVSYSTFGGLREEKFGMQTPLYHKLHYNVRGQLYDVRVSTLSLGQNEFDWNRGAVVLYYGGAAWGQSGTANNGNVTMQQHFVPLNESTSNYAYTQQSYLYDSLNRLSSVSELHGTQASQSGNDYVQAYSYDRYGNRTIDAGATWGTGINNKQFTVSTSNNRLGVPGGQSGTMTYDSAGNLTTDTYSGTAVTRVYDAENKMTSETTYNSVVSGSYSYDANGHRVKRVVAGGIEETWQVYGLGGELLAEYTSNGTQLSKEYGYRNGELLITATVTLGSGGSAFSFSDDPLVVGTTLVKAAHLNELRTAIDQARVHAGLSAASWAESITAGVTTIKASHVTELRTRLDEARTALGLSTGGYTDPALANGYDIKAAHISELRTKTNEALTAGGGTSLDLRWLVSDHLGTPRMIFDQSGSLANVSRHDYLPFGEEVPTGFRTGIPGYGTGDNVRQKFTGYERDSETSLSYAQSRYYGSSLGRFTTPDEPFGDQEEADPQSWHLYSYVRNNPLQFVDPTGRAHEDKNGNWVGDTDGECDKGMGACWRVDKSQPLGGYWDFGGNQSPVNVPWTEADEAHRRATIALNEMIAGREADPDCEGCVMEMGGGRLIARGIVTLLRGRPTSRLDRALRARGILRPLGVHAHHIVARTARLASKARRILRRFGLDVDEVENGVYLPSQIHSGVHTHAYYEKVNELLIVAASKEEAVAILSFIGSELQKGTFTPK